jgi:hypothetical protein
MREAWDSPMGLLLHDRENETVLIYVLVMGVVALLIMTGKLGLGSGVGGEDPDNGGDGDGGGDGC